jgi:hypothetical protein
VITPDGKHRFNPPPDWPNPPASWVVPNKSDFRPDPSWGPLPSGWDLWQPTVPKATGLKAATRWARGHKALTALAFFLLISAVGAVGQAIDPTPPATETAATAGQPEPPPQTPETILGDAIKRQLDDGNRKGVDRLLPVTVNATGTYTVTIAVNDNLTEGLTKDGLRLDVLNIIKAAKAQEPQDLKQLQVIGTYSLSDKFGAAHEAQVLDATFSRSVVDQIQPDGIDFKKILDLADVGLTLHPTFSY